MRALRYLPSKSLEFFFLNVNHVTKYVPKTTLTLKLPKLQEKLNNDWNLEKILNDEGIEKILGASNHHHKQKKFYNFHKDKFDN
jgi:hypothetical protein